MVWKTPSVANKEQRPDSNCYAGRSVTVLLKNIISSVIFHTKNWKIITSMHKRILGFTNTSGASKGITESHLQRGDLSWTLSECSKGRQRPRFSMHQRRCPLKSFAIFPCTTDLFSKFNCSDPWPSVWSPHQETLCSLDKENSCRIFMCWIVFPKILCWSPYVQYL